MGGALSIYAAKLGATCHAVEADSRACAELINSINENTLYDAIHFHPLAISNTNGVEYINSMTDDGLGNSESSLIDRGKIGQQHKVKAMTLPAFVEANNIRSRNISLIKIDTEGSEVLIIPGAIDWLEKHRPTIYISFHPAWFPNQQQDIEMFINLLMPVYKFIGVTNWGKTYDAEAFRVAMMTDHEHSFILKAR